MVSIFLIFSVYINEIIDRPAILSVSFRYVRVQRRTELTIDIIGPVFTFANAVIMATLPVSLADQFIQKSIMSHDSAGTARNTCPVSPILARFTTES